MKINVVRPPAAVVIEMSLRQARALACPTVKVKFEECCAVENDAAQAFAELRNALYVANIHDCDES